MSHRAPKYIWQKSATEAWLSEHELALNRMTRGGHAVVSSPDAARLRIEFFCARSMIAAELKATFGGSIRQLPENWETQWLTAHRTRPLHVGKRLTVVSDSAGVPDAATLVIPAGVAFGTGEHVTTAMSLRLLERLTRTREKGWRMLDAGTGSGILALAARRFGAGEVIALDNDPLAIRTAKWNARQNGIRGVKFLVAEVMTSRFAGRFDFMTANLYSKLLQKLLPAFRGSLQQDGVLILSGVLRDQEAGLVRSLRRHGFGIEGTRRRGKWIAVLARVSS